MYTPFARVLGLCEILNSHTQDLNLGHCLFPTTIIIMPQVPPPLGQWGSSNLLFALM